MIEFKHNSNFIVITGGPGVGKTTLLNELEEKNYEVVPEVARELIKEQKELNGEGLPWKNKELYKELMFDCSLRSYELTENRLNKHKPIFFDRGFLDTLCYATLIQSGINKKMQEYANKWRYNNKVFMLPPWQEIYSKDDERKQDWEEALLTYKQMVQTYEAYGYQIVEVPKVNVKERADFVIRQIG